MLTDKDARLVIERTIKDITRLKTLSDSLLNLANGTSNVVMQELVLGDILQTAVDQAAPLAKKKQVTLALSASPFQVITDETKLVAVVVILLDNAIKYSRSHTNVMITAWLEGDTCVIAVQDEGTGIAKTDISHIFDRFYRADVSRSGTDGHGLGLSIAQKIVHELGGLIQVSSRLGKGSTFTIRLPRG